MPRWTKEQFNEYQARRQRGTALLEQRTSDGIPQTAPAQTCDSGLVVVRVVSFRRRLLDEDNLCEKYHIDACRYAGLLHSDAPEKTHIEVSQVKISKGETERTEIEIVTP